jgi:hypothetical protein
VDTKHLNTLAGQIRLYIEKVLPQLERAGGFPDSPMDRKSKGTSNPPVGEKALRLWWEYRDYATKLNPLLAEMREHRVAHQGYEFREMIDHCVYDSASFGMRLAGDAKARYAFWQMCLLLSVALVQDWGEDVKLEVDDAPEDEIADPRKINPRWRTITANDAYWSIVARLERIRMAHPNITEKAAEVECQKELEALGLSGSIGRIRDAKTYVNNERGGNGGEAA